MERPAMENADNVLLPVWRANLLLLTRNVGAATRLARMMTFSSTYLKLMLAGRRDFSEEFVRGVEAVTGLPNGWMDKPHADADIPDKARRAIDDETPHARFRGTAHPPRKRAILRSEPIFGHAGATRDEGVDSAALRRQAQMRKLRDLAVQEVRRLERHLGHPPVELASLRGKIDDLVDASGVDGPLRADLMGRIEQIGKHHHLLMRHVEKLQALLASFGEREEE